MDGSILAFTLNNGPGYELEPKARHTNMTRNGPHQQRKGANQVTYGGKGTTSKPYLSLLGLLLVSTFMTSCFFSDMPSIDSADVQEIPEHQGAPFEDLYIKPKQASDPVDFTYLNVSKLPNKHYLVQRWLENSGFDHRDEYTVSFIPGAPRTALVGGSNINFQVYLAVASDSSKTVYWQLWYDPATGSSYIGELNLKLDAPELVQKLKELGLTCATNSVVNYKCTGPGGIPPSSKQLKALLQSPAFMHADSTDEGLMVRASASQKASMARGAAIEAKVKNIIAQQLGIQENKITVDSSLASLGADQVDIFGLILRFQSDFGVAIPDYQATQIHTVRDAIDAVSINLGR